MAEGPQDNQFDHVIDRWVRHSLARRIGSFSGLVRSLPGVDPVEAMRSIRRLRGDLPVGWVTDARFGSGATGDDWPVEHPLDFDWRFTPASASLLIDRCPRPNDGRLALLGAPSIARELAVRGWPGHISLFDKNPALESAARDLGTSITVFPVDLVWGDPVVPDEVAVTIADPPWYPEYVGAFLWAASRLTRIGGKVLVSLPPEGTRPGIPDERAALLVEATSFGLHLESIEAALVAYRTPHFERNAFLAAGVPEVASDWRQGDLFTFIHAEGTFAPRPVPLGRRESWDEVSVGIVRIKCRTGTDVAFRDPMLKTLVPGDMLGTVSRREPARAFADVWTCGNRVFRCDGPTIFRTILAAIEIGEDPEVEVETLLGRALAPEESQMVRQAAEQASDLILLEESELVEHVSKRREINLAKPLR